MRIFLLLTVPVLAAVVVADCASEPPVGPGKVTITETTTSTSTSTTTTSTIPVPTVARFVFSPVTPEEVQLVAFDASDSTPGTGRTIVSYSWDFGDLSRIKTGVTTTHDFFPSGVYLVTLTVTDSSGQQVKNSQTITVRPRPPPPPPPAP
jgi:PKD repeat protein